VTDNDIDAFESIHRVRIPTDFAQYFRSLDGMNDGDTDQHGIRFWPLANVRQATSELETLDPAAFAGLFVFADFMLWSHAYAIRIGSQGGSEVALVADQGTSQGSPAKITAPIPIAPSFGEFLFLYLREPESLFPK
jgi:hypothetical protein